MNLFMCAESFCGLRGHLATLFVVLAAAGTSDRTTNDA